MKIMMYVELSIDMYMFCNYKSGNRFILNRLIGVFILHKIKLLSLYIVLISQTANKSDQIKQFKYKMSNVHQMEYNQINLLRKLNRSNKRSIMYKLQILNYKVNTSLFTFGNNSFRKHNYIII